MGLKVLLEVSGKKGNHGQALIELAVFGTILLMIIGAMITYGLTYNYNQEAQMKAFRTALKIASSKAPGADEEDAGRSAGTYMVLEERHIPDPLDPYGAGSATTVMASASVTRDSKLHAEGDALEDLPSVLFEHQTYSVNNDEDETAMGRVVYRTAGFRRETLPATFTDPYSSMMGEPEPDPVELDDDGLPVDRHYPEEPDVVNCDPNSPDYNADACVATPSGPTQEELRDRMMMKYRIVYGSVVDIGEETNGEPTGVLRITDACAGEVIDYDTCYNQAVKIVSISKCHQSCARSLPPDSELSCSDICSMVMNPPNQNVKTYNSARGGAWYAANWEFLGSQAPDPDHPYRFPILENLFRQDGIDITRKTGAGMGLQDSPSARTTRSMQTHRVETTDAVVTDDRAQWTTTTERTFIRNRNLGSSGYEIVRTTPEDYLGRTQETSMNSTWVGRVNEAWSTSK